MNKKELIKLILDESNCHESLDIKNRLLKNIDNDEDVEIAQLSKNSINILFNGYYNSITYTSIKDIYKDSFIRDVERMESHLMDVLDFRVDGKFIGIRITADNGNMLKVSGIAVFNFQPKFYAAVRDMLKNSGLTGANRI